MYIFFVYFVGLVKWNSFLGPRLGITSQDNLYNIEENLRKKKLLPTMKVLHGLVLVRTFFCSCNIFITASIMC